MQGEVKGRVRGTAEGKRRDLMNHTSQQCFPRQILWVLQKAGTCFLYFKESNVYEISRDLICSVFHFFLLSPSQSLYGLLPPNGIYRRLLQPLVGLDIDMWSSFYFYFLLDSLLSETISEVVLLTD